MFLLGGGRRRDQESGPEREAAFWKAELDKAIAERTLFAGKFLKVREDNEALRAELFLARREAVAAVAQLDVVRKQEECRSLRSTPNAGSVMTSPLAGDEIPRLKGKVLQLQRELIAAESSAQHNGLRCAMLEERLTELCAELEAAHRQAEYARTTADAHQKEASALRSEVLSVRSINEETADETSKILNELSACQQRCAKLAAELSCKEQMVALLHLQVGDLIAAAAASTAANGASGRTSPARSVPAAAPVGGADGLYRLARPTAAAVAAAMADVRLEISAVAREAAAPVCEPQGMAAVCAPAAALASAASAAGSTAAAATGNGMDVAKPQYQDLCLQVDMSPPPLQPSLRSSNSSKAAAQEPAAVPSAAPAAAGTGAAAPRGAAVPPLKGLAALSAAAPAAVKAPAAAPQSHEAQPAPIAAAPPSMTGMADASVQRAGNEVTGRERLALGHSTTTAATAAPANPPSGVASGQAEPVAAMPATILVTVPGPAPPATPMDVHTLLIKASTAPTAAFTGNSKFKVPTGAASRAAAAAKRPALTTPAASPLAASNGAGAKIMATASAAIAACDTAQERRSCAAAAKPENNAAAGDNGSACVARVVDAAATAGASVPSRSTTASGSSLLGRFSFGGLPSAAATAGATTSPVPPMTAAEEGLPAKTITPAAASCTDMTPKQSVDGSSKAPSRVLADTTNKDDSRGSLSAHAACKASPTHMKASSSGGTPQPLPSGSTSTKPIMPSGDGSMTLLLSKFASATGAAAGISSGPANRSAPAGVERAPSSSGSNSLADNAAGSHVPALGRIAAMRAAFERSK